MRPSPQLREPTPAPRAATLFPTRLAVEQVLSDLLAEIRRRGDCFLDVKDVCARTTLSRNTIWELERSGHFPHRRQITTNKIAWLESEIDAWIASRPAAEDAKKARHAVAKSSQADKS
jgi:prophage regulatory protein